MNIDDAWKEATAPNSDIWEHLPTLEQAVVDLDAQTVIELGVRSGVSTVAFLHALQKTGGELWSVDINQIGSAWLPQPDWHFIQGDSVAPETLQQMPNRADLVFIDTSHAYDQTKAELRSYGPRVRKGGKIMLHDTEVKAPELVGEQPPYPVKKAMLEYAGEHCLGVELRENCFGLGILRAW